MNYLSEAAIRETVMAVLSECAISNALGLGHDREPVLVALETIMDAVRQRMLWADEHVVRVVDKPPPSGG